MIELTYDRDARTLYIYFTDIGVDEDAEQEEYGGYYLLDAEDQILGVHVDLGHEPPPGLLHYALDHEEVTYDQRGCSLRLILRSDQPASHSDFAYPSILDLDA